MSAHSEVQDFIFRYYRSKNEGANPEWDGGEAKALSALLKANPSRTPQDWYGCLMGRFHSDINHAERPRCWIPYLSSYRRPVNAFKQPKEDENGTAISYGYRSKSEKTLAAAKNAARFDSQAVNHLGDGSQGRDGRGGIFDLLAGVGRISNPGSDVGNRAALPSGRSSGQDFDAEPWRNGDILPSSGTETP